ncbi:MAG: AraC family transcriptional regulator [Saprospiraceae bacterium]
MKDQPKLIKFDNQNNPKAKFDLVKLEELFQRTNLSHSPEKLHRVEFYAILFIEAGQSQHTIDFTDYPCGPGTLLTIRKDQLHKFFKNKTIKGTLLLFTDEFLVSYLEDLQTKKTLLLFNDLLGVPKLQLNKQEQKRIAQIIERISNEYFNVSDDYSLGIIRSELHILITQLFRIKAQKKLVNFERKYLTAFVEFQTLVEENVVNTRSVKDYARMLGISTKTLNTITKSIVDKSAKEFVDEICMTQIKRLLINTDLSIKEIAYQSGFEETTNFYKYFKRQIHLTPEQFRTG